LHDIQKGTKTIKHNFPQILPEFYQRDAIVQLEIINRLLHPPDPSLENDMLTDSMRGRPTLRDVLSSILIFDGYNMLIREFINECRRVQNTISSEEEASVILLRQVARPSTRGASSATICYYRTIYGQFKNFIHGRYFWLLCRIQEALHKKTGKI